MNVLQQKHVIYEDNHLLVINKQAGQLAQGDETGDITLLDLAKDYIKIKYDKPGAVFLHPAHRLDRPVSGCLIFARTSKCLSRMTGLFRENQVRKSYLAISRYPSEKDEGMRKEFIAKHADKNKSRVVSKDKPGARECELHYKLINAQRGFYLYQLNPLTGRSHQIRLQMAHMGCPIVGDTKYGDKDRSEAQAIALHCYSLRFTHPVSKETMYITAHPDYSSYWSTFRSFINSGDIDG